MIWTTIAAALAALKSSGATGTTTTTPSTNFFSQIDLSAPSSAAQSLLGLDPSKLNNPSNLQELSASLLGNGGSIGNGFSISMETLKLQAHPDISATSWLHNTLGFRVMNFTQVSAALAPSTSSAPAKAGFGISIPLLDDRDWRRGSANWNQYVALYQPIFKAIETGRAPTIPAWSRDENLKDFLSEEAKWHPLLTQFVTEFVKRADVAPSSSAKVTKAEQDIEPKVVNFEKEVNAVAAGGNATQPIPPFSGEMRLDKAREPGYDRNTVNFWFSLLQPRFDYQTLRLDASLSDYDQLQADINAGFGLKSGDTTHPVPAPDFWKGVQTMAEFVKAEEDWKVALNKFLTDASGSQGFDKTKATNLGTSSLNYANDIKKLETALAALSQAPYLSMQVPGPQAAPTELSALDPQFVEDLLPVLSDYLSLRSQDRSAFSTLQGSLYAAVPGLESSGAAQTVADADSSSGNSKAADAPAILSAVKDASDLFESEVSSYTWNKRQFTLSAANGWGSTENDYGKLFETGAKYWATWVLPLGNSPKFNFQPNQKLFKEPTLASITIHGAYVMDDHAYVNNAFESAANGYEFGLGIKEGGMSQSVFVEALYKSTAMGGQTTNNLSWTAGFEAQLRKSQWLQFSIGSDINNPQGILFGAGFGFNFSSARSLDFGSGS